MDINERREALRVRVRGKLSGDEEEEELVVKDTEILSSTTEGDDLLTIDDNNGILALASSLIFIGSILGIITGILLLQGNPAECSTIHSSKMEPSTCTESYWREIQFDSRCCCGTHRYRHKRCHSNR